MASETPSFGKDLPDQYNRISDTTAQQIAFLGDVRSLFSERAALEKEYANKLSAIVRKAGERRSKRREAFAVGGEPSKAWGGDGHTLDNFFSSYLDSIEAEAQERSKLSDSLATEVADELKTAEKKKEDVWKKHNQFAAKLLADRDKIYSDRNKAKQKYDEECGEVESYRQKQASASNDRHAERAAKAYAQQTAEMYNSKNMYLISLAIANRAKRRFYQQDLPMIEDALRDLWQTTLQRLLTLFSQSHSLSLTTARKSQSHIEASQSALAHVDLTADQALFIEHNIRAWQEPADEEFKPCQAYYDTPELSLEPDPKVLLQNRLSKARAKLVEIRPIVESKQREISGLQNLVQAYSKNAALGNSDEVAENLLESLRQVTALANNQMALETEIEIISATLGDDEGTQQPHDFKSTSFTIPTTCSHCQSSIWGLSRQGKTCRRCGITVHAKCEMKVPADCAAVAGDLRRRSSQLARTNSTKSRASHTHTNSLDRIPTSPTYAASTHSTQSPTLAERPPAKVLYSFEATSPFELSVQEGDQVFLEEDDDGSGWVKIAKGDARGLVPASYVELAALAAAGQQEAAGSVQGSGRYVRALYDYAAQGADELSLTEGVVVELTALGDGYAEGWSEGILHGHQGIFPSSYVEQA